ncbi:MAG: SRPBCC family protein [Alphaproteobacteria bacterium]|nr:SRPBCC family protein [Alphaproteobacteria bacterium]
MRSFLLPLLSAALALPPAGASWDVLRAGDPDQGAAKVQCTHADGQPWCQSVAVLDAPADRIEARLKDFAKYPDTFPRIERCTVLDPQTVWIVLDMPFPLAQRDYIARFTESREGADRVFQWTAAVHPDAPAGDAVRLLRTAGVWRLTPMGERTRVSYTWQGELGGDVPGWALPRAWTVQGEEVLRWLGAAVAAN